MNKSRVSASNFNLKKKNDIISGYGKRKHENEKKAKTSQTLDDRFRVESA